MYGLSQFSKIKLRGNALNHYSDSWCSYTICIVPVFSRKVKEAWESKRDMLVKSGTFAIEQLSEALSTSSDSGKLPDGVSDEALRLCSEQVRLCASAFVFYVNFKFVSKIPPCFRHTRGYKDKEKKVSVNWSVFILFFT